MQQKKYPPPPQKKKPTEREINIYIQRERDYKKIICTHTYKKKKKMQTENGRILKQNINNKNQYKYTCEIILQ